MESTATERESIAATRAIGTENAVYILKRRELGEKIKAPTGPWTGRSSAEVTCQGSRWTGARQERGEGGEGERVAVKDGVSSVGEESGEVF